jgi:hypothetical protein
LSDFDPASDSAVNPNYPSNAPWRGVGGQGAVVNAYSGACWNETSQQLVIAGGGHADYAGNETYLWSAETGEFSRETNPTGAIGNTGTLNDSLEASGVYFDGQPRSFHTYNFFAERNGVVWLFGGSAYLGGNAAGRPFYWTGSTWVRDADVSTAYGYGGVGYDSFRDVFMLFHSGNYQPKEYDPNTKDTPVTKTGYCTGAYTKSIFYNEPLDCWVVMYETPKIMVGNCATNNVNATVSGTGPTTARSAAYDSANNRYLVWGGGDMIYTLTPPASNPLTGTWAWGSLAVDAGNTLTPTANGNGTYGRFWYSPTLKCCGVFSSITQKMRVFALEL